ncbi:Glycine amidinotransferase, mitochondrial [Lamellibrachia satsuma]|nr:Glycine amidinotransferase, mitochondrial [Lamellibrachia satsuma]
MQHSASQVNTEKDPVEQVEKQDCPVCAYTEWDPLEEVIVGRPEGARVPYLRPEIKATIKPGNWEWFTKHAGKPQEPEIVKKASKQVEEFCRILEIEGVTVRRPEFIKWTEKGTMRTPDFEEGGLHMACPRDSLVVIGNEIIEAPMAWRSRYFETRPYKKLLHEYFTRGAKWTVAPKPTMTDALYEKDYPHDDYEKKRELCLQGKFLLTEAELCFDAADIFRCGRDIFIQISQVTNHSGVEWLRRHLAPEYRVHVLNCLDPGCMHIDCTLVPLRPGLLIANPTRPCAQADMLRKAGWDIIMAPRPSFLEDNVYTSCWLSMNTLSLDEERIIVYSKEQPIIDLFQKLGLKPIPVDMTDAFNFGGAFHCWTVDVRRRGQLQSYFDW